MRNLKKFLALVLAMVMAFSLMLTANAAQIKEWSDGDQVTEAFQVAVDVLSGMKVYQGDERGFAPAANITRAEVAALIYRLATADTGDTRDGLYANYGNFTDVNEGDWFAGYVGYCANAGYIKGDSPTTFRPYGNVTGYEVLAMILRVVGYDKNHEFEGAAWQTNVSALATQLGILKNVKTTHYGDTLHLASRRDVVAELLFQSVHNVRRVTYTPALGYQQNGINSTATSDVRNNSLGWDMFGLTSTTGVVIGNQDTGEKNTRLGLWNASGSTATDSAGRTINTGGNWTPYTWEASYTADLVPYSTVISSVDTPVNSNTFSVDRGSNETYNFKTGTDLFGHKIEIWYNGKDGSTLSTTGRTVYAYYDKADATVIKADNTRLDDPNASTTGINDLSDAIEAAGYKVADSDSAVFSNSFGRFGNTVAGANVPGDGLYTNTGVVQVDASYTSPVGLYKIIDNNADGIIDAVITLNVESSQVTAVNNVGTYKTVSFPVENFNTHGTDNPGPAWATNYGGTDFVNSASGFDVQVGVNNGESVIEQAALTSDSTKTLKDYEIGVHITGTNGTGTTVTAYQPSNPRTEKAYFKLLTLDNTITGTVQSYNTNGGRVVLSDGTVLEQSILYNTVAYKNNGDKAIPQPTSYNNGPYKFYLTSEGKYIGAEPVLGNGFVYGTYVDYTTETSSGAFSYYLTGVDLDGKINTSRISTVYNNTGAGAMVTINSTMLPITDTSGVGDATPIPYRDASLTWGPLTANGIGQGLYRGAILGGTALNYVRNNLNELGIYQGHDNTDGTGTGPINVFNVAAHAGKAYIGSAGATVTGTNDIYIGREEVALGAVLASDDANGDQNRVPDNLYFTDSTKFILVSGYGTSDLTVDTYDGISDLRGTSKSVVLRMGNNPGATSNLLSTHTYDEMTYYTKSAFVYAQTGINAEQADVVILPREAVYWESGTNLYYVGDPTPTLNNAIGEKATQFTMYVDGEEVNVWLEGTVANFNSEVGSASAAVVLDDYLKRPGTAGYDGTKSDKFYFLQATNKTTSSGETIYTVVTPALVAKDGAAAPGDGSDGVITKSTYEASTYSAQTATFRQDVKALAQPMRNVGNAKVVNVNLKNTGSERIWANVGDLSTLNQASSLNPYGGNIPVKVCAILKTDDATSIDILTVDVIYVCFDQTN